MFIWKVNETPVVKSDKKKEEKEGIVRRVNKLVTAMGHWGAISLGALADCSCRTSGVREVRYLYSHSHQSVFGLLPQGVNFP